MSHISAMSEVSIVDLDAFRAACEELGLEFRAGQTTYKWYGKFMNDYHGEDAAYKQGFNTADYGKCVHAAGIPGDANAYEVGLVERPDGKPGFALIYDFYCGGKGLEATIGHRGGLLKQAYAKHASTRQMARQGFRAQQVKDAKTGAIKLTFTR